MMDYETLKDAIEDRLQEVFGSDFDSGCYINGEWLSVNAVLDIVLDEIQSNL